MPMYAHFIFEVYSLLAGTYRTSQAPELLPRLLPRLPLVPRAAKAQVLMVHGERGCNAGTMIWANLCWTL